ncbi:MAG: hypothetical protein A2234_09660 [Elusimicrobia bacterium RIFOXYA2_FULL_58_8]|nr:MAG: hypothetical protein A2285_06950 [Elusimicrobia bacterium RIFOXYA12_FULL_57_11]OGS14058.1 MAG: hypothetical protein A2234_09660 [Elusimicrobia bacterium RIFOXYA2_FULL_58_8]
MKYFDAHNHLQDYGSPSELAGALAAAAAAGVEGMLCCATRPGNWQRVLAIAAGGKGITPCLGVHPWFAVEVRGGWLARLEELLRGAAGLGEIGLDAVRATACQEEVFAGQLKLAKKLNRPAVIHCVGAWGRLLALLREHRPPAFLLHAYGGSPELVVNFTALGGYFSFGKEIMAPERGKLRAALKTVPRGRLLFETEAPAPGAASGPAGIADIVAAAAGILGVEHEELAELAYRNGCNFVNLKV